MTPTPDPAARHGQRAEQPAAPSAQWSCPRCGSPRWVAASLTGPVQYGGSAIKQCVPCGHYSNAAAEGRSVEPPARAYDSMPPAEVPRELAVPAAQALRDWHARNAAVCEHTQFVNYGDAADQMLAAVRPGLAELMAEVERRARAKADAENNAAGKRAEQAEAAIERVRRLCNLTITASCRAQAIDQAIDTLAVLDQPAEETR